VRSSASGSATGQVLIHAKEERLSPTPDETAPNVDVDSEYDAIRHENRHEIADERGFPPEWSYEEQFKKVRCSFSSLIFSSINLVVPWYFLYITKISNSVSLAITKGNK
jgi:hypothetical protein